MVIDFHTHIFVDELADRAREALTREAGGIYTPIHDMRLSGLLGAMDRAGVDMSVVQPVITKRTQVEKVAQWAASLRSDRIEAFAGIWPHENDYREQIDYIASLGIKGLKFHPEYQHFEVDADEMLPMYDYALSKGLMLLFHAGFDPAFPAPYKSSPEKFTHVLDRLKGGVIIAAHLGGSRQWEAVYKFLAGRDIYLDTSMGFEYYPHDLFLNIVEKHGADKILFGSDSPWSDTGAEVNRLQSLPLTDEEKEHILSKNALRLLTGGRRL